MNFKMKLSFVCYLLSIFILAAFGVSYLLRSEFMPYHSVAVGMPWSEVSPSFQILILALMKALGGMCLAVALSEFILLYLPFRQGVVWVRWLIPSVGLISCSATLYAMIYVASNTAASPPIGIVLVAVVLLVSGLIISMLSKD